MGDLAAWEAALDDLENRLDAAARSMAVATSSNNSTSSSNSTSSTGGNVVNDSAAGDWTAPTGLGGIPPELAVRVHDLLHNQQKLIGELEQAQSLTIKHLAAIRSVPPERDARASVYLDVNG